MKYLDISGPKGNAYVLLGIAKQAGLDEECVGEMMAGDYNHLLRVFNLYLGDVVVLCSPHELDGIDPEHYEIKENEYL